MCAGISARRQKYLSITANPADRSSFPLLKKSPNYRPREHTVPQTGYCPELVRATYLMDIPACPFDIAIRYQEWRNDYLSYKP